MTAPIHLAQLPTFVFDKSGLFTSAGMALTAIAELLGADGGDHALTSEQTNGLHHAVLAIGEALIAGSYEIAEAADRAKSINQQEGPNEQPQL